MEINLNPTVLRWARERAALSMSDLASKLRVSESRIAEWEQSGVITFKDANNLAHRTYTPFGYLYLTEAPEIRLPISDFRTINDDEVAYPSCDLIETIDLALFRQDWLRDYFRSIGAETLSFVGAITSDLTVLEAANIMRRSGLWGTNIRASANTWEEALRNLIDLSEEAGIVVMRSGVVGSNNRRILNVDEFRGFALADKFAPLVFINAADTLAAQMFTLGHELVHIWLGVSGISNLNNTYAVGVDVETFCNRVAAELLVPEADLRQLQGRSVQAICRIFKVSSLVVLRRLRDLDYLTQAEFNRAFLAEQESFFQVRSRSSGGNYYRTHAARISRRFSSALVESLLEGKTSYRDALHLFGTNKVETIKKYARELNFSI